MRQTRAQLKTLVEKSTSDDQLIDQLQSHVSSLNLKLQEKDKELRLVTGLNDDGTRRPISASHHHQQQQQQSMRATNQEHKLIDQERIIAGLREEVRKLKLKKNGKIEATPAESRSLSDYFRVEAETQSNLFQIENSNLRKMLAEHEIRFKELETELFDSKKRIIELESNQPQPLAAAITAKLAKTNSSITNSGSSSTTGRQPRSSNAHAASSASNNSHATAGAAGDTLASLRSQLQAALSEQKLVQSSYSATLASREQDIAILNEILNQKNQSVEQSVD